MTPRVGIGYDSHRFAPGRRLVLGGVEIEHEAGLEGHSDADVVTHAIIDAVLGAAGLGDIGVALPARRRALARTPTRSTCCGPRWRWSAGAS